jgi:hypothetical protein
MLDFNIIIINRKDITEIVDLLIAKMVDAQTNTKGTFLDVFIV